MKVGKNIGEALLDLKKRPIRVTYSSICGKWKVSGVKRSTRRLTEFAENSLCRSEKYHSNLTNSTFRVKFHPRNSKSAFYRRTLNTVNHITAQRAIITMPCHHYRTGASYRHDVTFAIQPRKISSFCRSSPWFSRGSSDSQPISR